MLQFVQYTEAPRRGHSLVWWRLLLWSGLILTSATAAQALQLAAGRYAGTNVVVISPPVHSGEPGQSALAVMVAISVEDDTDAAECLTTSDRVSADAIQVRTRADRDRFLEALGCGPG
jgi:hypothetical protein